jgi:hypothetical protein
MRKAFVALSSLLACWFFTGCIENASLIDVKKDGSGTIVVRSYLSSNMTGQMKGAEQLFEGGDDFAGDLLGDDNGVAAPNDDALVKGIITQIAAGMKKSGEKMGEGVTFTHGKEVENKKGWKGYEAHFSFEDINNLTLSSSLGDDENGGAAEGPEALAGAASDMSYTFEFTPGDEASLKIIPLIAEDAKEAVEEEAAGLEGMEAAMLGMMKPMLAGMRISAIVRVAGEIQDTNASFRPGNKNAVVLYDVQMEKLLDDPKAFTQFTEMSAAIKESIDKPGLKMQQNAEPTFIKFK